MTISVECLVASQVIIVNTTGYYPHMGVEVMLGKDVLDLALCGVTSKHTEGGCPKNWNYVLEGRLLEVQVPLAR